MQPNNLHNQISAVCPIQGISIALETDKSTWRIDFDLSATPAQKAAAQTVLQAFDVAAEKAAEAAAAQRVVDVTTQGRADAVVQKLRTADLTDIQTYVNTNVTDLPSAKALLVKLAVAIVYALRNDS